MPSGFYGSRGFSKRTSKQWAGRNSPDKRSSRRTPRSRGQRRAAVAPSEEGDKTVAEDSADGSSGEGRADRTAEAAESDARTADFYDALSGLEGSYNRAQSNLFPRGGYAGIGGYGGNPFSDALDDGDPEAGDETPTGEGDGDPGGSDPPATPVDTEPPAPVPGGDDSPASKFSFLLLFDGGVTQGLQVARAHYDGSGSFTLESGERVSFFSSLVNIPSSNFFALGPGTAVMTGEINNDDLTDAFVISWEHLGTALKGYLGRSVGGWQENFGFFWPYQTAQSFALYDFDSDGATELVVVFSDSGNLFIYEITEQGLKYDREVVVPFRAAWVVKTHDSGVVEGDYLEVFDPFLSISVTFSSRYPGIYSHTRPPTFVSEVQVKLNSSPGSGSPAFQVLEYRDRAVLFETTGNYTKQLGSFVRNPRFPSVIVGDFLKEGTQQLILVP